jgi:hypothetical protein
MKKILIGLMAFVSFAATAASFSYQGVLKKADGTNFEDTNRNPEIIFRLYTEPTGGTALWGRTIKVHLGEDGLFNVELSDSAGSKVKGLENTLDYVLSRYGNSTLYIGMEVDSSTGEIRPRQKLPAVPLASFAQDVKTARGDFKIEGNATISGSLIVKKDVTLKGNTTIQNLTVTNGATLNGITSIESLKVGGKDYTPISPGMIMLFQNSAYWYRPLTPDGFGWRTVGWDVLSSGNILEFDNMREIRYDIIQKR